MPSGDFEYYICDSTGNVYAYRDSYYGDRGKAITSEWATKILDFSDQYPEDADKFYTVYKVTVMIEDVNDQGVAGFTTFYVYVSNDGGETYGYNDSFAFDNETGKKMNFWVIATGDYFVIKLYHSSAADTFTWVGMEIEYLPLGDRFD